MHDPHLHLCVGVTEGCVAVRSSFQVKVPEKPGVSGVQVQSHKILLVNISQIILLNSIIVLYYILLTKQLEKWIFFINLFSCPRYCSLSRMIIATILPEL